MESVKIKDLTKRISQSSRGQLLLITYDILLDSIESLKEYIAHEQKAEYTKEMRCTQKILQYLINTLDLSYEVSYDLLSLYMYVQKLLIKTSVNLNISHLEDAEKILHILLKGWKETIVDEAGEILMENSQKVYAGLTYGKGTLNEYIDTDNKRGFTA